MLALGIPNTIVSGKPTNATVVETMDTRLSRFSMPAKGPSYTIVEELLVDDAADLGVLSVDRKHRYETLPTERKFVNRCNLIIIWVSKRNFMMFLWMWSSSFYFWFVAFVGWWGPNLRGPRCIHL